MSKIIAGGKYQLTQVINSGSFGKVYQDPPYAIKEVRLPSRVSQNKAVMAIIQNEINILTRFNHENIVKLFEMVEEGGYIYIVMELCDADLRRYTQCGPINEKAACNYLRQIVNGYKEMVKMGIVHRDLKPANILIKNGCLKIADFGMSKLEEGNELLRSHVGTPYYMAPQVLQRIDYTRKCDVWSMGVIFYQLLFGCLPWMGRNEESLLSSIMTQPLRLSTYISQQVRQILQGMLAISQAQRLSCSQVQKLLTLYEKMEIKQEETNFHWSIVKELMQNEAQHHSQLRFKLSYSDLNPNQQKQIKGQISCLLREEEAYFLHYL